MRGERFVEIDIARGVAIVAMVVFHVMWDMDFYRVYPLNHDVYQLNKAVAFVFLFIVGICVYLASIKKSLLDQLKRGLLIFNIGMGLTIVSIVMMPERPIIFGVLHCIGLSTILCASGLHLWRVQCTNAVHKSPMGLPKRYAVYMCLVSGMAIMGAEVYLDSNVTEQPTVLHLMAGMHQNDVWRHTIDYFPLVPWIGVVLMGMAAGKMFYTNGERCFETPSFIRNKILYAFSAMGRHSLPVYLLHQPVLVGIIKYVLPVIRPILNL